METRALDAINAIRELHAPQTVYAFAQDCPVWDDPEVKHTYDTDELGADICVTCPPAVIACSHCTHDGDDVYTAHPCPTLLHTIDIEKPAEPKTKGGRRG